MFFWNNIGISSVQTFKSESNHWFNFSTYFCCCYCFIWFLSCFVLRTERTGVSGGGGVVVWWWGGLREMETAIVSVPCYYYLISLCRNCKPMNKTQPRLLGRYTTCSERKWHGVRSTKFCHWFTCISLLNEWQQTKNNEGLGNWLKMVKGCAVPA